MLPMNSTSRHMVAGACLARRAPVRLEWTNEDIEDIFEYASI